MRIAKRVPTLSSNENTANLLVRGRLTVIPSLFKTFAGNHLQAQPAKGHEPCYVMLRHICLPPPIGGALNVRGKTRLLLLLLQAQRALVAGARHTPYQPTMRGA